MNKTLKKIYHFIREFSKEMNRENVSSFAASAAFFIFVSMIPVLYILCTIISVTSITEAVLVEAIEVVAPNVVGDFFITLISDVYNTSAGVVSVAVIITLWSAGKGMLALMRGLNGINHVTEHRNYFLIRLIAGIYTLIMLVLVVFSLVFLGFGKIIAGLLMESIPGTTTIFEILMKFRFLYVWPLLTIFFSMIYAYVPNKKSRFKRQLPGALLSAVSWTVFSWGFSMYIKYFGALGGYGSLTTIILVLLWLYFSMYILFVGAKINALVYEKIEL